MPKRSTVLDVAFTVEHNLQDPHDLLETDAGRRLVFDACFKRLQELLFNQIEIPEAFGVLDTCEIPSASTSQENTDA